MAIYILHSKFSCRASACLFSAVENVYDAIEIRGIEAEKSEFQVSFVTSHLLTALVLCVVSITFLSFIFVQPPNFQNDRLLKQLCILE